MRAIAINEMATETTNKAGKPKKIACNRRGIYNLHNVSNKIANTVFFVSVVLLLYFK